MNMETHYDIDLLLDEIELVLNDNLDIVNEGIGDQIWSKIKEKFSKLSDIFSKITNKLEKFKVIHIPKAQYNDIEKSFSII